MHYLSLPCSPCMFVHNNKVVSCWFAHAKCVGDITASSVYADVARLLDAGEGAAQHSGLRLLDS